MSKIDIKKVLDMMNEEVGYKGLNNDNKKTNDRDDVVSRQAINKWINQYNEDSLNTDKIQKISVDQFITYYYEEDIKKLINRFRYNLQRTYKQKTISKEEYIQNHLKNAKEQVKAFGLELGNVDEIERRVLAEVEELVDRNGNIAKSLLERRYTEDLSSKEIQKEIKQEIEEKKNEIVNLLIDLDKVEEYAKLLLVGETVLIEDIKNECIK